MEVLPGSIYSWHFVVGYKQEIPCLYISRWNWSCWATQSSNLAAKAACNLQVCACLSMSKGGWIMDVCFSPPLSVLVSGKGNNRTFYILQVTSYIGDPGARNLILSKLGNLCFFLNGILAVINPLPRCVLPEEGMCNQQDWCAGFWMKYVQLPWCGRSCWYNSHCEARDKKSQRRHWGAWVVGMVGMGWGWTTWSYRVFFFFPSLNDYMILCAEGQIRPAAQSLWILIPWRYLQIWAWATWSGWPCLSWTRWGPFPPQPFCDCEMGLCSVLVPCCTHPRVPILAPQLSRRCHPWRQAVSLLCPPETHPFPGNTEICQSSERFAGTEICSTPLLHTSAIRELPKEASLYGTGAAGKVRRVMFALRGTYLFIIWNNWIKPTAKFTGTHIDSSQTSVRITNPHTLHKGPN